MTVSDNPPLQVRRLGQSLWLDSIRRGHILSGELKRLIPGVSDKVLIQQLKDLEADRVLARTDYKEVPPRVDYALTPLVCGCSRDAAVVTSRSPSTGRKAIARPGTVFARGVISAPGFG